MSRLRPDTLFAAALVAVAALLLAHAVAQGGDALGLGPALAPMLFPQIVLGAWLTLAVIELVRKLMRPAPPAGELAPGPVIAGAAVALAYAFAMPRLGFLLASWGAALAIPLVAGYRRPVPLLAVGLLAPLALWYLFHRVLQVRLPVSGILPGF